MIGNVAGKHENGCVLLFLFVKLSDRLFWAICSS